MLTLPRPRILLALIAIAAVLGGFGGFGGVTWIDYSATLFDVERDLSEIALMMAEHTRAVLVVERIQLDRAVALVGLRSPAELKGSRPLRRELAQIVESVPDAHSVWLIDAKGDVVATSLQPEPPAVNVADREYFSAQRDGNGGLFVSPLLWGRVTGGHFVNVSQRLNGPDGRFNGVVALSINADHFLRFYRGLAPENGAAFLILKTDGSVVVRQPLPEKEIARLDTASHPLNEMLKEPSGHYRSRSLVDGVERLVAYQRMPELSLIVAAGVPVDAALADWRGRTLRNGLMMGSGLLLVLALVMLASESSRREHLLLERVERKAQELGAALADKEVLFQEIHHRVKNNLQVISSMLTMQSMHLGDEGAKGVLQDALDRIHSMGLVHQTLYEGNQAAAVDLSRYFNGLVRSLGGSHQAADRRITIAAEVAGTIDLDRAVPLGLVANEAVANALKHAFPDGRPGSIRLALDCQDGRCRFTVRDDGIGLGEGGGGGIGFKLMRALARQLAGELEVTGDNGTAVSLTFPT
jgi:two-component sensor histidine kinase